MRALTRKSSLATCSLTRSFHSLARSYYFRTTANGALANMEAAEAKDWSAKQYLKFKDERTRPARELLAQVALDAPKRIIDLGCGPGNSTAVLAERFPSASLCGIDSSPDMIKEAEKSLPEIPFDVADLQSFEPDGPVDLFFANAVFQWLPAPDRLQVLRRLLERLSQGGVLAFQVPDNLTEPSHVAMQEVAFASGAPWSKKLSQLAPGRDDLPTTVELYDTLAPFCSAINIWRTTYHHVMGNHQGIVEWVKGTGLRPFIDPLTAGEKEEYLSRYLARIQGAYPMQRDGQILLAYPRLFVVAEKK